MALLDKQIVKQNNDAKEQKVKSREHSKINIQLELDSSANEVERFSVFVLKTMISKGTPPTPDNYKIFFEKLLDERNIDFQKKIQELLEFEESNYNENRVEIEKDIKEIFIGINSIIKVVNSIYKNIHLIKQLSSETEKELQENKNNLIVKNIASTFESKLKQFVQSINNQLDLLKEKYQKAGSAFKNIENSTIFDTRFGVYNKRYFVEQAKKERQKVMKFHHQSSIVSIEIKENILKKLPFQKDKIFLLRIVAKMLLKTSRRNDIISYFGGNSFIMLLRHTNIESTKGACNRIFELLINSNIVLNDTEIDMDIGIGIAMIKESYEVEESINCALDATSKSAKNKKTFEICDK